MRKQKLSNTWELKEMEKQAKSDQVLKSPIPSDIQQYFNISLWFCKLRPEDIAVFTFTHEQSKDLCPPDACSQA